MGRIKLEDSSDKLLADAKKKPKDKLKRRLRPLVKAISFKPAEATEEESESENVKEQKESKWNRKYLIVALLVAGASYFISQISISSCGFWATYENNYNKIVHKDERWCYRDLEGSIIIQELKEQVIGQDDAISLIAASFELANREKIIQMAFLGSIGVGKTLTANIITQNFKWQSNVGSFIFGVDFKTEDKDFDVVASKLSDCGYNLVVIDDIEAKAAERIAKLERRLHRLAKQKLFKIVFIVIFKEDPEASVIQETLKDFVLIEFQPFTEETFEQCIAAQEKLHNLRLKPKEIAELKFIDFASTGCKTLAKKINLIVSE